MQHVTVDRLMKKDCGHRVASGSQGVVPTLTGGGAHRGFCSQGSSAHKGLVLTGVLLMRGWCTGGIAHKRVVLTGGVAHKGWSRGGAHKGRCYYKVIV